MPIFKVTVKETVFRKVVAYVDAPNAEAADKWSGLASAWQFRDLPEEPADTWGEVESVEPVDAVPDGWRVRKADNLDNKRECS
jgi:hypothetical protein